MSAAPAPAVTSAVTPAGAIDVRVNPPKFNTWTLLTTFTWVLDKAHAASEFVHVAAGFVTDFASIPRPLWWLWPPSQGPYLAAALVHDCLYKAGYVTRADGTARVINRGEADRVMLDVMRACDTPLWTQRGIYRGVRVGGWVAWRRHRKADGGGGA